MPGYRIVSADDHVMEPADLWTSRAGSKFRDRAPRVVRMEDGSDWWFCDGNKTVDVGAGTQAGMRFEEPEKLRIGGSEANYENVRPGGYIPEEHVKDMDIDGIDVSIVYPSVVLTLYRVPDSELLTSNLRTYNDWLAEFCDVQSQNLQRLACRVLQCDPQAAQGHRQPQHRRRGDGYKGAGALRENGARGSHDHRVSPRGKVI